MARLVVDPVVSSSRVRRALLPGDASDHGTVEGDHLVVEDADRAQALVDQYPNVRWAGDADAEVDTYPDDTVARMDVDSDGVTYPDDSAEDVGEWDEDEWLDGRYQDRADMVRTGAVDAYLEQIESVETSETVKDAVAARRDELEG